MPPHLFPPVIDLDNNEASQDQPQQNFVLVASEALIGDKKWI